MTLFSWLLFAALSNAEEENVALQFRVHAGDAISERDEFAGTYSLGEYRGRTARAKGPEPTCRDRDTGAPVPTVASCEEYADSVGQQLQMANLSNYPHGCSVRKNHPEYDGVWWNFAQTGHWDQHPVFTGEVALVCIPDMRGWVALGPYPGSTEMTVTGFVKATVVGAFQYNVGVVDMSYSLFGGTECEVAPDCVANGCGIQIHQGNSCDQVGEHVYNTDQLVDDPWLPVRYQANAGGVARSSKVVLIGSYQHLWHSTVVVYDKSGGPIACAVLPPNANWVELGPYPGSTIEQTVTGYVEALYDSMSYGGVGVVGLSFILYGGSACSYAPVGNVTNACGIHIHSGDSCDQDTLVGGPYYNTESENPDPWLEVIYQADQNGLAFSSRTIVIGADQDISGRTVVVHDDTGARIACAVLP